MGNKQVTVQDEEHKTDGSDYKEPLPIKGCAESYIVRNIKARLDELKPQVKEKQLCIMEGRR